MHPSQNACGPPRPQDPSWAWEKLPGLSHFLGPRRLPQVLGRCESSRPHLVGDGTASLQCDRCPLTAPQGPGGWQLWQLFLSRPQGILLFLYLLSQLVHTCLMLGPPVSTPLPTPTPSENEGLRSGRVSMVQHPSPPQATAQERAGPEN